MSGKTLILIADVVVSVDFSMNSIQTSTENYNKIPINNLHSFIQSLNY